MAILAIGQALLETRLGPMAHRETTISLGSLRARPKETRRYLVVFEAGSSSLWPLPAEGELVIGRGAEAGLRVEDSSISRGHARLAIGEAVTIEDLGSRNGTRVNGARIRAPRVLRSGDAIHLSETLNLVFHSDVSPSELRPVLDLESLRLRLEEELERFLRFGRPLAVIALRVSEAEPQSRVLEAIGAKLRLIDFVAWDAPGLLLAVLPERGRAGAQDAAAALLDALRERGLEGRAGFASAPEDGVDTDGLLGGAIAAASAEASRSIAAAAESGSILEIGEQRIVVADPAMIRIYQLVRRLADSEIAVLIRGETGSGKEIAALALHHWSKRSGAPFVTVNCAALPESLVESELFGHQAGAFSGAAAAKPGLFEAADRGTFFLDEVGELSAAVQAKLLRVLETQKVMRLGEVKERSIEVRFVAATNRDLDAEVKTGRFRQDLAFRLNTAQLILPPLRDRPQELPILARTLLERAAERAKKRPLTIAPGAMARLLAHSWPGNIRELKNAMDFVAATVSGRVVEAEHLPASILAGAPSAETESSTRAFRPLEEEVQALEKIRMIEALDAAGGVKTHAAQLLAVPLRTFLVKLDRYGIAPRPKRG